MEMEKMSDIHERYVHKKTGCVYEIICNANLDTNQELMIVYKNTSTGDRWICPATEFNDGRFERVYYWWEDPSFKITKETNVSITEEREACKSLCVKAKGTDISGANDDFKDGFETGAEVCIINITARGEK